MSPPKISVCITTYNQENYIYDCIMSVIAQSHEFPIEILVGNDKSSDLTGDIISTLQNKHPELIRFFDNKENLGPSGNYQNLIKHAKGQFIAHLDGDDYWLPGKLRNQITVLESNNKLSAAYTNALCISDCGVFRGVFNNPQPSEFNLSYLLHSGNFLNHSSLMYRATLRAEILNWNIGFIDYKIHLYLASQGNIAYINQAGVAYRVGSQTSLILHEGERVRDMYWQALVSFPTEKASDTELLHASADLLRRVFFRALNIRSTALFINWWRTIKKHHNKHTLKLKILTAKKIATVGLNELKRRISSSLSSGATNIIYRR